MVGNKKIRMDVRLCGEYCSGTNARLILLYYLVSCPYDVRILHIVYCCCISVCVNRINQLSSVVKFYHILSPFVFLADPFSGISSQFSETHQDYSFPVFNSAILFLGLNCMSDCLYRHA
jgi:hypothetical protein